jgi:hypothetical protein
MQMNGHSGCVAEQTPTKSEGGRLEPTPMKIGVRGWSQLPRRVEEVGWSQLQLRVEEGGWSQLQRRVKEGGWSQLQQKVKEGNWRKFQRRVKEGGWGRTFHLPPSLKLFLSCAQIISALTKGVTKRCRLSWLTNSGLVYEPKCGGRGELQGFNQ